jgi:hypothetical protein
MSSPSSRKNGINRQPSLARDSWGPSGLKPNGCLTNGGRAGRGVHCFHPTILSSEQNFPPVWCANPPVVRLQPPFPDTPCTCASISSCHPPGATRCHLHGWPTCVLKMIGLLPGTYPTRCGVRRRSGGGLRMGSRSACARHRPRALEEKLRGCWGPGDCLRCVGGWYR